MKVLKFAFLLWLMFSFFEGMGQLPQPPVMVSVSVVSLDGHVEIKWNQPGILSEIDSFAIDRWSVIDGYQELSKFLNDQSQIWIDTLAPANTERCMYQMRSKNNSGWSVASSDMPLLTTFLYPDIIFDTCALENTFSWSQYDIRKPASHYRIHYSIDGGANFSAIEDVPVNSLSVVGSITHLHWINESTNIYEYTHDGLVPDFTYHYKVEPLFNGVPENIFSNIVSKESPAYVRPNPPEIVRVSVNESSGYVDITYETSITDLNLSKNIVITRNDPTGSGETPIPLTFPPTSYMVSDENVFTETTSYIYELELTDNCFNPVPDPVKHRTILLEGNIDPEFSVSLNWNGYEGWDVIEQKLYRKQGTETPVELVTLFLGENSHIDDVSALPNREALFQYYLVAYGSDQNVQFSRSNTLSLQPDFDPVMPNAFYPGSSKTENTTFKPVITFYNSTNYILQIYNRWGAVIWETNDPDEGWTGKNNSGKLQPMGVYVYLLQYEEAAGLVRTKRGTVSLIH
jgi:gliding motility-associated-like protein